MKISKFFKKTRTNHENSEKILKLHSICIKTFWKRKKIDSMRIPNVKRSHRSRAMKNMSVPTYKPKSVSTPKLDTILKCYYRNLMHRNIFGILFKSWKYIKNMTQQNKLPWISDDIILFINTPKKIRKTFLLFFTQKNSQKWLLTELRLTMMTVSCFDS